MRNSFRFPIFAAAIVAVVTFSYSVYGQEATTEKELPNELTTPARTAQDAIDEQTEQLKQAADNQAKATKDAADAQAKAVKDASDAQLKAAADAAAKPADDVKSKKPEADAFYQQRGFWVTMVILAVMLILGGKMLKTGKWFVWLLVLGLSVAALPSVHAANCFIPAGQPFVVSTLTVVPDAANPNAPHRGMVMPDQERKFQIKGCGFGWDVNQVVVGLSGDKVGVIIDEVANDHIIIKVKPAADAALNYRNLAVAVTDEHGRKNLISTPLTLEVAPPTAYWALQALELHGVGTPSKPAPMVDNVARDAALAAAHNATTATDIARVANDSAKVAADSVTKVSDALRTTAESLGRTAEAVGKVADNLKSVESRVTATENGLRTQGARIETIQNVVDGLRTRPMPVDSSKDVVALQKRVTALESKLNAVCSIKVGAIHQGTICDKAGVVPTPISDWKPLGDPGVIRNPVQ